MQPGRFQRLAQHQIAFLLGLLQYLRIELAADHRTAYVRQAFEQCLQDVEAALAGTQALVAQHGERREAAVDNGEGFLGGGRAAHGDAPGTHQALPGGGHQGIVVHHQAGAAQRCITGRRGGVVVGGGGFRRFIFADVLREAHPEA